MMKIIFKDTKVFSADELKQLFTSVNWLSADYSRRLSKALPNFGGVYSAWDGEKLIGLIAALDDGELTAYIHYLLVNPQYHNMKIGTELLTRICKKYDGYLYVTVTAESRKSLGFYEKFEFTEAGDSVCIVKSNFSGKDGENV